MSQFYQFTAPKGSAALEACYGPQDMRVAVAAERKAYEQGQTEVLWWLLLCLERARRIDVSMQATALMTLYYAAVWRPQFSTRKSWKQHMVEYSNTNAPAYYTRIVAYLRRPCPLEFVHLVFRNLHRVTNTMTNAHIFIDMLETYVQCH